MISATRARWGVRRRLLVSGRITGQTDTMPLRVEKLFQEYNNPASFAVASLLCSLALATLAIKTGLE